MRAGDTHASKLAYSVELLLHELCARLILQELHLLLELELSDLFLAAKWVLFPFDVVHLQLMLHTIELLLKLELAQLPLRLIEFLGAIEMLKLFALVEFVDLFLLDRLRPLLSELVGRRPAGGSSQKQSRQQKTCSNGPEQFHWLTSFSF